MDDRFGRSPCTDDEGAPAADSEAEGTQRHPESIDVRVVAVRPAIVDDHGVHRAEPLGVRVHLVDPLRNGFLERMRDVEAPDPQAVHCKPERFERTRRKVERQVHGGQVEGGKRRLLDDGRDGVLQWVTHQTQDDWLAAAQTGRGREAELAGRRGSAPCGKLDLRPHGARERAGAMGAEIQFAAWGRAATPGQFGLSTAARLRGREPIVLGLVGHPLEHSISPVIQETALAALDLPAVYLPFDLSPGSLEAFWLAMDRLRIRGFNVTHPLKESVAQRVDEMDADAERLGAVNTVVVDDGWTNGHNTDVYGFRVSLRALGLRVGGRSALVVGAGGAAKAVVHVLLREGASVQVTNRTIARADALADSFDEPVAVVPMKVLERSGPWDLLVNATPIGMKGIENRLPVPEAIVAKAGFIYDLVYNPTTTPLLLVAQRLNRPGTSGLDMLLHQAAKAFELWTGASAPFDAMRRAAKEALR